MQTTSPTIAIMEFQPCCCDTPVANTGPPGCVDADKKQLIQSLKIFWLSRQPLDRLPTGSYNQPCDPFLSLPFEIFTPLCSFQNVHKVSIDFMAIHISLRRIVFQAPRCRYHFARSIPKQILWLCMMHGYCDLPRGFT